VGRKKGQVQIACALPLTTIPALVFAHVTYFTDNLSRSELENVSAAWAMLHRHGRKEEEYQQANDVLNSLHRVSGLFSVLEYKIADNPLRIEYLKFS
jgi:hypothetical protein